ncbi:MAG: M1 family peptidase [Hyphomicrobiales bacterium]|nr:M1 family peptidase [Hyphomicrobiales bacterium]MCP5370784.1 M1 family peptidase [Hyphomicrobiales bacterium]
MAALVRALGLVLLVLAVRPAAADTPLRHDLDLRLDPAAGTAAVTDRVTLPAGRPVAFALPETARLRRVTVDGRPTEPRATGGAWRAASDPSRARAVEIDYVLAAPAPPRGRIAADGTYLPGGWTPRFGDAPFDYRLTVAAPAGQRAVVPGRLVREDTGGDGTTAVFESEYPDDHIPLFAGPYRVTERRHGGLRLRTYFHAGLEDLADGYLDQAARYLDLYGQWIGAYPFSAFHMVSSPLPVGLGFRNLTYMGIRVLRLPFIRFTSLGHEVLHNWWGNGVLVDYAGGNWCEGLTTYMADYTFALQRGADRARDKRLDWLRDYAALPAARETAVRDFVSKAHDAAQVVGYNKVAFIFHMLRERLGAEAFDAAIRRFWDANKFRAAGWDDLRRAFETASGTDLGVFFDQWVDRVGAPALRLEKAAVLPGNRVRFTLAQDDPPYALRVPVRLDTAAGPEDHVVDLAGGARTFTLAATAPPTGLAVDPDFDLFRRLAPGEAPPTLRDVTLDGKTRVLVLADGGAAATARELAARMLDSPPAEATADAVPIDGPLLVIGLADRVRAFRRSVGLSPEPDAVAGHGTARAWVERRDGRAVLTVAADDAAALADLLRPLPHYGRSSYLAFDGRKATVRGTWPVGDSPLAVSLPAP